MSPAWYPEARCLSLEASCLKIKKMRLKLASNFNRLHSLPALASILYFLFCMALTITSKIFISISKQIASGRGVRGILIANEYLDTKDPLRKALLMKAEGLISPKTLSHSGWIKVKDGALFSELSSEEQMILSFENNATLPVKHLVPDFSNRRFTREKKKLRPVSKIKRLTKNRVKIDIAI